MKLSKHTLQMIKNFSSINTNILFRPGNTISTKSPSANIYGEYQTAETFPLTWGCYDVNELLSILSTFQDPDLEFSERFLTISEGNNRIRYLPADPEVLIFPKKAPNFPADAEVEFELTAQNFTQITRVASALKAPFLTVRGDRRNITLVVHDKETVNSKNFTVDVGTTEHEFEFHIKIEWLKMVPDNYTVSLTSKKWGKFSAESQYYIVTCEIDSTFTE